MKNLFKLTVSALLVAGMSSCSLFDVEVDTEFHGDLDIAVEEPATKSTQDYDFSASTTINPMDDDDVNEYSDMIEEIDVTEVVAEVLGVRDATGNTLTGVVFLAGTEFTIENSSHQATWTMTSDWTLETGTEVTLEDLGSIYGTVSTILETLEVFEVSASGTCNQAGVYVDLRIGISTTVTANPL